METGSVAYIALTLFTVSYFNLRILQKIGEIEQAYLSSREDVLDRLSAVERGLERLQAAQSRVDGPDAIE